MNKTNLLMAFALFTVLSTGIVYAGTSGPSPIPLPPNFQITSQPILLCKGQINNIPITVTNAKTNYLGVGTQNLTGTAMQGVTLSLGSSRYLASAGNGTAYIGSIPSLSSATTDLHVFVNQSAPLINTVPVAISYYYLQLYSDSEVRNLSLIAVQCPSQLTVNMTPKTLTSGEIQNITIRLKNNGNSSISNINVHWSLPPIDGAVVGSQEYNIKALGPGNESKINASVFVSRNASIESFPVNITATFYSGSELEQVLNSTSIIPTGAINLLPSGITLSPSTVPQGSIFSISFVLTDIGTSGASAASAYVLMPQGFSSYGTNPVYIGDIGADTQSPVTVTLISSPNLKPGVYNIPIRINYLNGLRQNQTSMMNVSVNITKPSPNTSITGQPQQARSGGSGLLTIILFIALVAVAWLYYQERKKGKKR